MRWFSDNKYIYSVDMMFAFINQYKPKKAKSEITTDMLQNLSHPGWDDGKHSYSALTVLKDPKKYKDDFERIKKADLSYPIIISDGSIVDGVHRLAKAFLTKATHIPTYDFSKIMPKFVVAKRGEWDRVGKIEFHELMQLFLKRFPRKLKKN